MKNKNAKSIVESLTHFLKRNSPTSISCDAGLEFENKIVKDLLESKGIKLIIFNKSDQSDNKKNTTSIIERANRTLR